MSRGGFSRGGRGRGGVFRVGGQDLPWDPDPTLEVDNKPQQLFPPMKGGVPRTRQPNEEERAQVEHFKAIRQQIHEGPYYTEFEDGPKTENSASSHAAQFDPFEGVPTYTQRYKPAVRRVPKLSDASYELHLFPEELWDLLDPRRPKRPRPNGTQARNSKRRKIETAGSATEGILAREQAGLPDEVDPEVDEDVDEDEKNDEENDDGSHVDPEEDFSEDEDEMAGDYNAEKYFDAGEGNGDDYGDGGDEGGYD